MPTIKTAPVRMEPVSSRFVWNRPVHWFRKKPAVHPVFSSPITPDNLLSEPDRRTLWFAVFPVEPPVRSVLIIMVLITMLGRVMWVWLRHVS